MARTALAAAVLLVLAPLASCSDGGTGAASASGSARESASVGGPSGVSTDSTSASPSPAGPSSEAPPPAPAYAAGPAGQRAFARHVVDLWGYALRTDDAHPLTALAPAHHPCAGCAALASTLRRRDQQGWSVDFPRVPVRKVTLHRTGGDQVATAVVDIPQSDSYYRDGSYRNSNPAHPRARFTVRMRAVAKSYRLVEFSIS